MERRLTTILAADLAGYSRLMAADEEGVIRRLRAARAEVIDPAIAEGGGRIVKVMGDGLLVEFSSPVAAVRAALAVQDGMRAREAGEPEARRLRFRVGINLGDVVIDGEDVLGDAVNVAARLETLAPVGGLCIGRSVWEQARGRVAAEMTPLGLQAVKNLPEPVEVWRVEVDGAEAPRAEPRRATRPSIAVLPFDNMSSDPDQEFLADGIVEDVITELSRFRSLMVIARNSTFAYKGRAKDIRRIGEELGARYVVEGSVRRGGNRLRVTAQLIEAATSAHVWADRWDRTLDDLFALQDELTQAIVTAVEPELGAHERRLARARPTESLTAWELCQRGLSKLIVAGDAEALRNSRDELHAAATPDPEFALPWALLARAYWNSVSRGLSTDVAGDLEKGLAFARRALELDPRLDATYYPYAGILGALGRAEDADSAAMRGLALNPNNALLHHARATASLFTDDPDPELVEREIEEALRLSPQDPWAWSFYHALASAAYLRTGDPYHPHVVSAVEAGCRYDHAGQNPLLWRARADVHFGRIDRAKEGIARILRLNPRFSIEAYRRSFPMAWVKPLEDHHARVDARLAQLGLPFKQGRFPR